MDIAAANIADFWGEPIEGLVKPLAEEYYVAREYSEYVTRIGTRPVRAHAK